MQLSPEFLYLFSYALVILMKIVCFIISYKIVKLGYVLLQSGVNYQENNLHPVRIQVFILPGNFSISPFINIPVC